MVDFTLVPTIIPDPGEGSLFAVANGASLRLVTDAEPCRVRILHNLSNRLLLDGDTYINQTIASKRHQVMQGNREADTHVPMPLLSAKCLIALFEQARDDGFDPFLETYHTVFRHVLDQPLLDQYERDTRPCFNVDYGPREGFLARLLNQHQARGGALVSHNHFTAFIAGVLLSNYPVAEQYEALTLLGARRWEVTFFDHQWEVIPETGQSILIACKVTYRPASGPAGLLNCSQLQYRGEVTPWGKFSFRFMTPDQAEDLYQQRHPGAANILLPPEALNLVETEFASAFVRRERRRVHLGRLVRNLAFFDDGVALLPELVLRTFGGGTYHAQYMNLTAGMQLRCAIPVGTRQVHWTEPLVGRAKDPRIRTRIHQGQLQLMVPFLFDGVNLTLPALLNTGVPVSQLQPVPGGAFGDVIVKLAATFDSTTVLQRRQLLASDLTLVGYRLPPVPEVQDLPEDSDGDSDDSESPDSSTSDSSLQWTDPEAQTDEGEENDDMNGGVPRDGPGQEEGVHDNSQDLIKGGEDGVEIVTSTHAAESDELEADVIGKAVLDEIDPANSSSNDDDGPDVTKSDMEFERLCCLMAQYERLAPDPDIPFELNLAFGEQPKNDTEVSVTSDICEAMSAELTVAANEGPIDLAMFNDFCYWRREGQRRVSQPPFPSPVTVVAMKEEDVDRVEGSGPSVVKANPTTNNGELLDLMPKSGDAGNEEDGQNPTQWADFVFWAGAGGLSMKK